MKRLPALLLALVILPGCDQLIADDGTSEAFSFKYAYATEVSDVPLSYTVTTASGTPCAGVPDPVSFALLAGVIQRQSDFFNALANCAETFLLAGAAVQDVRDTGLHFDYRITGGQNDAIIRANRLGARGADPAGLFLQTSGGLTLDQPTTLGSAEVQFLASSDQFRCENGGPVWADNADTRSDTFFMFELTDQDAEHAEGLFQCITRNASDASDTRLLLLLDGSFNLQIR